MNTFWKGVKGGAIKYRRGRCERRLVVAARMDGPPLLRNLRLRADGGLHCLNSLRPHSALGNQTPQEFAQQMARKTPVGF